MSTKWKYGTLAVAAALVLVVVVLSMEKSLLQTLTGGSNLRLAQVNGPVVGTGAPQVIVSTTKPQVIVSTTNPTVPQLFKVGL